MREIDALGGYSGIVTDHTMVQFRMLNRSKGPAMWSPRAQSDRMLFARKWRNMLEAHPNVDFWQDMVKGLVIRGGVIHGVVTSMGLEIPGKAVVLTNGTFLNASVRLRRETTLKNGDILSFGEVQYWFLLTGTLHEKLTAGRQRGFV